ncbi:MAG: nucleotidyltransferase family protein [Cohaesibacter sp.]|jgi:molybdenum cofactor cytidylyltransferase|nr:nucleotidyltransferase family protein [Cohaesibacter sp.]
MPKPYSIDAILLAAGQSRRMAPQDKLLLPVGGQPMLRKVAQDLIQSRIRQLHVFLPQNGFDGRKDALGGLPHRQHRITGPDIGLGHSLAFAVQQLRADCDGVLVMLADMPSLSPPVLNKLIEAAEPEAIIAPSFKEQRGNPVLFGKAFFKELSQLSGDEGGKRIILHNKDKVRLIPMADESCCIDIDSPKDWANYNK